MPEMDIRTSANTVVDLLQSGQADQAIARLQTLREGQAQVVQEALDRYVAAGAADQLTALRQGGNVPGVDAATLSRLETATRPPRMPEATETAA